MQTGMPAKAATYIERLSPGYVNQFSPFTLALAVLGTLAWFWLVKWRVGRSRHPLWKSLVLPASGVALCLLLVMTLLLSPLDNARSYRSLVQQIAARIPAGSCVLAPKAQRVQVAALEYLGGYDVDALASPTSTRCDFLIQFEGRTPSNVPGPGWRLLARERRSPKEGEVAVIYRRPAER
jgi:hypothetical protein